MPEHIDADAAFDRLAHPDCGPVRPSRKRPRALGRSPHVRLGGSPPSDVQAFLDGEREVSDHDVLVQPSLSTPSTTVGAVAAQHLDERFDPGDADGADVVVVVVAVGDDEGPVARRALGLVDRERVGEADVRGDVAGEQSHRFPARSRNDRERAVSLRPTTRQRVPLRTPSPERSRRSLRSVFDLARRAQRRLDRSSAVA